MTQFFIQDKIGQMPMESRRTFRDQCPIHTIDLSCMNREIVNQTSVLLHVMHVNGWDPGVYRRQNFPLFHLSTLPVLSFRLY